MSKKYFEDFGCVVGDEAHLFKSKSLTTIMTKLINCKYRFGMTGTLDGTQTHRLVLEGLFGKVEKVTTTKELMDKDTLANLKIKCLVLKHKENECKEVKWEESIIKTEKPCDNDSIEKIIYKKKLSILLIKFIFLKFIN